jgi:HAAS
MEEAGVISDYLEKLADALRFDRSLSRCVRQEVEDHLREAVAADPTGDRLEAERRAIANFGDPHVIAAEFALVSLTNRTRRLGAAIILVIVGVLATMKARVAWYALMQWTSRDDMNAVSGVVLLIDRYTFLFSVVIGVTGWAYIVSRRISAVLDTAYRKQLGRAVTLCIAATTSLALSVISDGVLTVLKLHGTQFCAASLVPVLSMAIEVLCIGVLAFQMWCMTSSARAAEPLMKTR